MLVVSEINPDNAWTEYWHKYSNILQCSLIDSRPLGKLWTGKGQGSSGCLHIVCCPCHVVHALWCEAETLLGYGMCPFSVILVEIARISPRKVAGSTRHSRIAGANAGRGRLFPDLLILETPIARPTICITAHPCPIPSIELHRRNSNGA